MTKRPPCIAVLGAGSWGTALAMQLARSGSPTVLWARDADHIAQMRASNSNERYLPGIAFPQGIYLEENMAQAVEDSDYLLIVTPSHAFGETLASIRDYKDLAGVAWASKGFEPGSGRFLHQVAQEQLGLHMPLAVLTGPSFAKEVAQDLPTAVTVAGTDMAFTQTIAESFHGGRFRAYTSPDIVGAELGGAVKNVLAIATGICDGMGLGDNARAALVTRGLAEMMRLGRAMDAKQETLMGLAGMGDLVLTCTGDLSRNRRLGLALGRGGGLHQALDEIGQVVEGVGTAEEVKRLASRYSVEMPISHQVHGILHRGWDPIEGVKRLLSREQKLETD